LKGDALGGCEFYLFAVGNAEEGARTVVVGLAGPDLILAGAEDKAEVRGGARGQAAEFGSGGEVNGDDGCAVEQGGEGAARVDREVGGTALDSGFQRPWSDELFGGTR